MIVEEFLNLVFLSFALFFVLLSIFLVFLGRVVLHNFLLLEFVEVGCLGGDVAELMHLHEFLDPFSSLIEHGLFDAGLLYPLDLGFKILSLGLELFGSGSLDHFEVTSLLLGFFQQ